MLGIKVSIVFGLVGFAYSQFSNYEVYYEWKQVDYTFPNDSVRNEYLESGRFVPINCAPTGIKVYKDMVFIATPRYRGGVPSTLNVIPYRKSYADQFFNRNQGPKLKPFPSWEMNEEGNCDALQLVQAMELDPYGRLWIVDVGRTEALTPTPNLRCPPKLVIYDLPGNKIDRVHVFPEIVAPRETNAVKDIQVACTSREDCFTYISNAQEPCSIIIYDYKNDDSWFAIHPSMQPEITHASITINGVTALVPFGQTGLGLTPRSTNYSTLYYSKIAGTHIYSIPTEVLKDSTVLKLVPALPDNVVRDHGEKPMGQADGTAMDNRGRWYFGSLPQSAVYSIDTNQNPDSQIQRATRVIQSDRDLQWPDTFSYDGKGYLLFTTTRFQLFSTLMVNPEEVNYRLIRFRTGTNAYNA